MTESKGWEPSFQPSLPVPRRMMGRDFKGWGYSSVGDCLPSKRSAFNPVPNKQQKPRRKELEDWRLRGFPEFWGPSLLQGPHTHPRQWWLCSLLQEQAWHPLLNPLCSSSLLILCSVSWWLQEPLAQAGRGSSGMVWFSPLQPPPFDFCGGSYLYF